MSDVLNILKEEGYRLGACQVLLYDRKRTDVFSEGYLSHLYQLSKQSGRRGSNGILPRLFCGMPDISHDAITCYLAQRPVLVLAVWESPNTFWEAGFAFPVVFQPSLGIPSAERSAFAAYGFFRKFWGTPEMSVLGMLGLAYMFEEWKLLAIHGTRYPDNYLTARFMQQFGSRDVGSVPRYQLHDGKLTDGVVSSLLLEDFEAYVERQILSLESQR